MEEKDRKEGKMIKVELAKILKEDLPYCGWKARGDGAGSRRGMVHSGVRPAGPPFHCRPRVRPPQLTRPTSSTCYVLFYLRLLWGPQRAAMGPGGLFGWWRRNDLMFCGWTALLLALVAASCSHLPAIGLPPCPAEPS